MECSRVIGVLPSELRNPACWARFSRAAARTVESSSGPSTRPLPPWIMRAPAKPVSSDFFLFAGLETDGGAGGNDVQAHGLGRRRGQRLPVRDSLSKKWKWLPTWTGRSPVLTDQDARGGCGLGLLVGGYLSDRRVHLGKYTHLDSSWFAPCDRAFRSIVLVSGDGLAPGPMNQVGHPEKIKASNRTNVSQRPHT